MKKRTKCEVSDYRGGSITAACFGLDEALNSVYSRSKGVVWTSFMSLDGPEKGQSRNLIILRSGQHEKRGLVCNFCPFCGTRLYDLKGDNKTPPPPRARRK